MLRTVSGENLCFIILRSKKSRTYSRIIDKGFSIQFSKLFEHSGSVSLVFNGSGSVKILSIRRNPDPCVTGSLLSSHVRRKFRMFEPAGSSLPRLSPQQITKFSDKKRVIIAPPHISSFELYSNRLLSGEEGGAGWINPLA